MTFQLEVDRHGRGQWTPLRTVTVPPNGYQWLEFDDRDRAAWVRVITNVDCPRATAFFHFADIDSRPTEADPIFRALARDGNDASTLRGGLLHAGGDNKRTLQVAAVHNVDGKPHPVGSYELRADMTLAPLDDRDADSWMRKSVAVPTDVLTIEPASVLYVDDNGRRWRLPKAPSWTVHPGPFGAERVDREAVTERDLFNAAGIFYELPAENAGGFAKVRPVATHGRRMHDYCSWRGLLVVTGLTMPEKDDPHVIRSADGRCAVWVGAVDDLWKLGKPIGIGGPWLDTRVTKDQPSDPYLMTGFDHKTLSLRHAGGASVDMRVEVDIAGTGHWQPYRTFTVEPNVTHNHVFPRAFGAYWLRVIGNGDVIATAQLRYE